MGRNKPDCIISAHCLAGEGVFGFGQRCFSIKKEWANKYKGKDYASYGSDETYVSYVIHLLKNNFKLLFAFNPIYCEVSAYGSDCKYIELFR